MSKGQSVLGVIVVTGFIAITVAMRVLKVDMPEWAQESFTLIVGAWIVNFTTVVNWYFGSSKGSSDKSQIMRTMIPVTPEDCVEPITEGVGK